MSLKVYISHLHGRSVSQFLMDLRIHYASVSAALILVGFFWNNLEGFDWSFIALVCSIFYANVFGFVVNDYYDSSYDIHDIRKKNRNVFCSSSKRQLGKGVLFGSLGFSLLFSGMVSAPILFLVSLFDFVALLYSAPPIRLRSRLYWDWIFVFLWKGLILFTGYYYFFGTCCPDNLFIGGTLAIVLFSSLFHQIQNQIRDFTVDKLTHTQNSVQHFGFQKTSFITTLLMLSLSIFGFGFCFFHGLYITMISILLNVVIYYYVNPKQSGKFTQFAHIWIVVLFLERGMLARALV